MILKNKKLLIATSLLILLPIPLGLLLWDRFPETMAIHWGITGQADGYASIPYAVFVPPVAMLAVQWLCILVTALDKGNKNRNQKIQKIVLWSIPLISNLSCCGIYALALGWEFSPVAWTVIPMGILFAVIGNYMPKTRMNRTIGIRVRWAYTSEDNWNATHRFGGKIWMAGGILMALCAILPGLWAVAVMLTLIPVLVLLPVVYSWRYYKKELAEGKNLKRFADRMDGKTKKVSAVAEVLLVIFLAIILFYGEIHYVFQDSYLKIDTNMYTDYVLQYDDVDSVEFREENVPGLRIGGYGSFRLLMGHFENGEFGRYIRYTYYQPEACVIVTAGSRTVVLSGADRAETAELYDRLMEKCF